ncbi:MAG: DNA repair protein RadA [Clostridia bacterium]|nr:DNA repair protein RadA [Clostridia bacterium]
MKGNKTIFVCSECGYVSPKWMGKCQACGAWNTMTEEAPTPPQAKSSAVKRNAIAGGVSHAVTLSTYEIPEYFRDSTGMGEFDRVLGGGLVDGSVVLLSGEPGIGKSTLLMQISAALGESKKVMYISGEESGGQLKLRSRRLGIVGDNIYLLTETNIDSILAEVDKIKPDILIVDSIQTIYSPESASSPGSVTQVKECALAFIARSKNTGFSTILVGHVNKEGGIAGPKVLEHMVDAVLCFEGDRQQTYRIIRAVKNRYGSTNEIGVFEMTDKGLEEVPNPSEMLLAGRPKDTPGNCALCSIEGTRPIIAEIQALVTPTVFPSPRRTANGIDYNRMYLILAVLEKRLGLRFSANDVYLNVIGGLELDEPAADMSVALAMISSLTDKVIPDDLIALGELGLSGECRAVSNLDARLHEAARLGFTRAVVPYRNTERRNRDFDIELIPVKTIYDALRVLKKQE